MFFNLHSISGCIYLVQGIIYAYDVTRRETFEAIQGSWMKEVAEHANIKHAVMMVVANKVDRDSEREVSRKEGAAFANSQKCLFVETSAKANTAVTQVWRCFVAVNLPSMATFFRSLQLAAARHQVAACRPLKNWSFNSCRHHSLRMQMGKSPTLVQ